MAHQLTESELLVKYGFIKKSAQTKYTYNKKKGYYTNLEGKEDYNSKDADEEIWEERNLSQNKQYEKSGYPESYNRFKLIHESFNLSMEELYYWCLNHMRRDMGFPNVIKITDMFSASEQSSMFGQSNQRLAIQEDRASNFLRGISELVKTLFQIIRELRIIDERMEIYDNWEKSESADSTLKGLFVDFAENKGGQQQPGSLYILANQVGYAALPDLFFNLKVYKTEDIDKKVESINGFNPNVKNVLKRKLYQFVTWKIKTHKEIIVRRNFQIKYLRQHYLTIKMYMSWVKPYLKHIKRLQMNQNDMESPDLVGAFETSANEIEILGYRSIGGGYNSVILMNFKFHTRPVMNFRQEMHQGPAHVGKGTVNMRAYGWTDHQIEMYKKMRDYEDRELLGLVDDQLESAMDMLGEDLETYLEEAESTIDRRYEHKPKQADKKEEDDVSKIHPQDNILDPFIGIFKGFYEIISPMAGVKKSPKKIDNKITTFNSGKEQKAASKASGTMWTIFKNYKKSHKLLSW